MIPRKNRLGSWLRPALAASIAAAAGQTTLAGEPAVTPATLTPLAGTPTTLELRLPARAGRPAPTWDTANVAQFFVRSAGEQTSHLPVEVAPGQQRMQFSLETPGPALLCIGLGPPEARGRSDSWQRVTHCTKIVFTVRPKAPLRPMAATANPGITAKAGQKVEILPLADPTRLRIGDDLPVRVYYEGVKVEAAIVTAAVYRTGFGGPSTRVNAARPTDAHGTTWLPIKHAGIWVVRFVHEVQDEAQSHADAQQYVAELVFEVGEGEEP